MFRSIFKRREPADKRECRERGLSAAAASASHGAASQVDPAANVDLVVDETMVALSRELSGLARLEVGQAAKERGWAALQRELERRPVRAAAPVLAKDAGRAGSGPRARRARSGGWRWAVGSAAAAVAVIATLVGTYAGGVLQTAETDNPATTIASVITTDGTEPSTTLPTDGTTVTEPGTTVPTDVTTVTPDTTPGTTGSSTTGTSQGTDSGGSTPTSHSPTTTQPPQTTTTNEQVWAAQEVVKTAEQAAISLGGLVVDYFWNGGDISSAHALVSEDCWKYLVQMIESLKESLKEPSGFRKVSIKALSSDTVRVVLEFTDRVDSGQDELTEVTERFALTVHVGHDRAVVTAISAGS